MPKAILVIDMPETCSDCSCSFCGDIWRCMAVNGRDIQTEVGLYEKPSWCPLKPYDEDFIKEAVNDYGRL